MLHGVGSVEVTIERILVNLVFRETRFDSETIHDFTQ